MNVALNLALDGAVIGTGIGAILLYAVLGEFETQLNNFQAAIDNFRKALELTELRSEQLFLSKRLRDSEEHGFRIVA